MKNRATKKRILFLDSKFKFGKYKNKLVTECTDPQYITWMHEKTGCKFHWTVFDHFGLKHPAVKEETNKLKTKTK